MRFKLRFLTFDLNSSHLKAIDFLRCFLCLSLQLGELFLLGFNFTGNAVFLAVKLAEVEGQRILTVF